MHGIPDGVEAVTRKLHRSPQLRRATKWVRHALVGSRGDRRTVLIVGCQRSGTSLLLRLFDSDPDAVVFGEKSRLFVDVPGNRRMRDLNQVVRIVGRQRAGLVVIKPLVESHRVIELLDAMPPARGVWVYRHYADVAVSNLRKFGRDNGHADLAPILADDLTDWRTAGTSAETRQAVRDVSDGIGALDAAALFWWVRNSILFDNGIVDDPRMSICRYDALVRRPERTLGALYQRLGRAGPRRGHLERTRVSSIGGGADVALLPEVGRLCDEMLSRLDDRASII